MVDDRYMRRALDLAKGHRTHPNPKVGSVVLSSSDEIVGEGAHVAAGQPHAEVVALAQAGAKAGGGTLYVTLEPCSHQGRTPPCVDAIIRAGIRKVVVAMTDPDHRVTGSGIAGLQDAGVEVITGVLGDEAAELNAAYLHHRTTGLPLVTVKWAMTVDGSAAADDGTSRWISGEEAREDAHLLRADADAVVVGAGTIRADDPLLDVRIDGYEGPQPRPVIVTGSSGLPRGAVIWGRDPVVIAVEPMEVPSGEVAVVQAASGVPEPTAAARAIADLGYLQVLLEGGPTLAGSWWRAGVVTKGVLYLAAKAGGGAGVSPFGGAFYNIGDAEIVEFAGVRSLGPDLRIDFFRK